MSLYYTAPSQEMFDEIKREAIKIWQTYDNTHGYVDEKVGRIAQLRNIKDNYLYIVSMFDSHNQSKLMAALKPTTRKRIDEALA